MSKKKLPPSIKIPKELDEPVRKPMGRKPIEIDWDTFNKLCSFPIKQDDISWILDVSVDKLANEIRAKFDMTFSEYMTKRQATLRLSLLQKQYQVAMNGNVSMLIWLGKNWLGQRDKFEEVKAEEPVTDQEKTALIKQMLADKP